MNPLRTLVRATPPSFRPAAASSSTLARLHRRSLTTPTSPLSAKVSDATVQDIKAHVQEDAGEYEDGDHVAAQGEGGEDMFGFKLNPVATKTGGNAKSEGRPIYLDMQVSWPVCFIFV